jgi:hypothetical protein
MGPEVASRRTIRAAQRRSLQSKRHALIILRPTKRQEGRSDFFIFLYAFCFKVGVGYGLLPEGRVCCWGGMGGLLVIIDVDRRITFAYVTNKMAPGEGPSQRRRPSGWPRS